MSEKLGNINIILTNSFYQNSEKEKADLINENNYYSMMNKKRKRKNSHKSHKLNISKCPSCASSFLRKYYYHIHNDKNVNNKNKSIENRNNKIIEINENQNKSSNNEHKLMKNDNNNNNLFMDLNSDKYNYETQSKNHNYANNYNKIEIYDYKNIPMNINCINQDKNIILNKNQNINNFSFNNVNDEINEYSQSHNDNQINNQKIWITKIKEENEKIKNENLPKKSGQIYLKVKKCVAPEI